MSKILELNADREEQLCEVAKALSIPTRIQILKLLYYNSYNIGEIAEQLHIPASTAALHIRTLESAGLINTEQQPGSRGSMKLCSRKNDFVSIRLVGTHQCEPGLHCFHARGRLHRLRDPAHLRPGR